MNAIIIVYTNIKKSTLDSLQYTGVIVRYVGAQMIDNRDNG